MIMPIKRDQKWHKGFFYNWYSPSITSLKYRSVSSFDDIGDKWQWFVPLLRILLSENNKMVKVDEWSSINWSSKNGTNMTIHTCEQDSEFVLRFVCTVSKTAWARARCTALRGMGFPPSAPTHILVRHEFIFRYHLCEMSLIPFLLNTYSYRVFHA